MVLNHGAVKPECSMKPQTPLDFAPAPKVYGSDRKWSDNYLPGIRRIVGARLMVEAPFEDDCKRATDLIVLRARDMDIAARVRRYGYYERYPYEFTVRSMRDSGAATEYEKIINGWGDWMFYGHAAEGEISAFDQWFIIDLHAFRAHLILNEGALSKTSKDNGDGTYFKAFDLRSFPAKPPILIASKIAVPTMAQGAQ